MAYELRGTRTESPHQQAVVASGAQQWASALEPVVAWDARTKSLLLARSLLPDKTAVLALFSRSPLLLFLPSTQPSPTNQKYKSNPRHPSRCVKALPGPLVPSTLEQVVNISSSKNFVLPTQSSTSSVLPFQDDLNSSNQLSSSRSSSLNTATIHGQDFPVFTTDSNQSTWLPSSSSSLPALSAHQQQLQHLNLPNNQQDFVLFDQPIKRQPNRSVSQPSANGRVNQNNQRQHQHRNQQLFPTSQLSPQQQVTSPSVQHQRVASIIQATGHNPTSSALTNRFSSPAQNQHQFYASSAPSSTVALNLQNNRPVRPPVPLFTRSTGTIPQGKMHLQDLNDLEDFTAFEGGASTAYSSPAISSVFDLSGSVSTNMGTVSPQDLLIHEPFMSAPNSTALTALTSPSIYNESPDFGDSFDVSPNFGSSDFDGGNDWFPLFPTSNPQPELPQVSPVEKSPAQESDDLEVAGRSPGHERRKSGGSPPSGRHSSISGVNARHRNKPLPPIVVEDPTDTVAMKRARNTLAARKSRERKAQKFEELEAKIAELEAERDRWRNMALSLGGQQE